MATGRKVRAPGVKESNLGNWEGPNQNQSTLDDMSWPYNMNQPVWGPLSGFRGGPKISRHSNSNQTALYRNKEGKEPIFKHMPCASKSSNRLHFFTAEEVYMSTNGLKRKNCPDIFTYMEKKLSPGPRLEF